MMLNKIKISIICLLGLPIVFSCQQKKQEESEEPKYVSLLMNDSLNRLDIFMDGKYFTSYLYADEILRKPVLFPIFSASEKRVTRGFPIATNPGERIDHPHHYGLWFNHGDVNDVDFWNSAVIPRKPDVRYGRINHKEFTAIESGDEGRFDVVREWRSDTDELYLTENTRYVLSGDNQRRTITHSTTLYAPEQDVLFRDSKEGVFAIRVRRELEVPSKEPVILTGDDLVEADSAIVDSVGVSGYYRNSEGLEGYPEVWGKRARWMQLAGVVEGDSISICIFDHPDNVNYPSHWMARDYGLYGVNGLGSNIYTKGEEELNFMLKKGDSVTFINQVQILNGYYPDEKDIEKLYKDFLADN